MKRKIGITVSALILAIHLGSPISAEQPDLDQLEKLTVFLEENDVLSMREYLALHPDLLEGNTQLSVLLRKFLLETSDVTTYFALEEEPGAGFEPASGLSATSGEGFDFGDRDNDFVDPFIESDQQDNNIY